MGRLDIPVIWLVLALLSTGAVASFTPSGLGGWILVVAGLAIGIVSLALMLWAVGFMRSAGTTVMPRGLPSQLVTGGPFRLSRNPIYLGMAGVVAALALVLGAPAALVVVPVFMQVITSRFIKAEETDLEVDFGASFAEWCERVGRWIGPIGRRNRGH